jgi:hypothetical protein
MITEDQKSRAYHDACIEQRWHSTELENTSEGLLARACFDAGYKLGLENPDNSIAIYDDWERDLRERIEAQRMDFTEIAEVVSEVPRLFKVIDALRSELGRSGGKIHDLTQETHNWSAAVKKLEAERAARWVLTKDDLPPIGEKVLVEYGPHNELFEGHHEEAYRVQPEGSETWWWAGMETMGPEYIIAWFPIPERKTNG